MATWHSRRRLTSWPGGRCFPGRPVGPSRTGHQHLAWRGPPGARRQALESGCASIRTEGLLAAERRWRWRRRKRHSGELCWRAECEPHRPNEHLHSKPPVAPRGRVGGMSQHPRGWNYHESGRRAPGAPLRSTGATGPPGAGVRMREAGRVRYSGRAGIGEGHPKSRQREGVRTGASGSSQRDRPGLQGAWRAGCSADVGIGRRVGMRVSGSAFVVH